MGSGALHVSYVVPSPPPQSNPYFKKKLNNRIDLHYHHSTLSTFIRADFADNEQIEELLAWTHPHLESPSESTAPSDVVFTEAENAAMLRLPRKECKCLSFYLQKQLERSLSFLTIKTSPHPKKHTTST